MSSLLDVYAARARRSLPEVWGRCKEALSNLSTVIDTLESVDDALLMRFKYFLGKYMWE